MHVLIIGGGIGGLCLAQGLRRRGVSVAVYERDRTPDVRLQGYRLSIEPPGSAAAPGPGSAASCCRTRAGSTPRPLASAASSR